ncbi:xanthine dehydrogenase family protein molybdopterin-binding subunit [Croceicoccus sp. BE223]|uniref:xanthine dehydrogenase family protein molybdopterin-binding subunit n=1 Tax=Croceicoccus sp. BE223 TaxID=2817716 RepID=UPI00285B77C1|nr:xanthine dehydrogenase family protein molybdopterin-binding subunit [Croceicoccus sp. BE223]MDR7103797.1 xanthine dehydrogenase YagR molybdenum-binding subunit [Croceicoccus sp. BE223]
MTAHLKFDKPDNRNVLDTTVQGVIGQPLNRPDGLAKVTGSASYAAEYDLDGCLQGVLVTAPFTRGHVTAIDKVGALAMPGVVAVIDDPRLTRRASQGSTYEAPKAGACKVDYHGQPVALVVAETFEQARDAAMRIGLEYEADDLADIPLDPDKADAKPKKGGTDMGDLAQAMSTAAHSVDLEFTTEGHASAAMEMHAATADWDGKVLTVRAALQMLNYNIAQMAKAMDMKQEQIRLLSPYVGGGFGSKLGITEETVAAGVAAMELGRPVRVVMSRQQVFGAVIRRSETRQRLRLAADADGRLVGFGHEALVSNLPGERFAEPVLQSSHFLYSAENRLLRLDVARVHRMTAGSVRAPGEAVGMPTLEVAMDALAEKVGIDPIELRLRNIPERDPESGKPFTSHKLAECLTQGAKAFGWESGPRAPRLRREGEWWIGTGVASGARAHFFEAAQVRVTLNADGTALVETDMTDIGTGTYAVLSQVVGEMLGLSPEDVQVDLGDTRHPRGPGSGGSWGAASTGSAAFLACETLRRAIATKAGVDPETMQLKDGRVVDGPALADVLGNESLSETGHFEPGDIENDYTASGFGAFFAEVRVNDVTGEVRVDRMLGAFGFGRVLNAKTARSQCLGGLVWSIGVALTEGLLFDPNDGHVVNGDLAEYHVPVNRDVGDMEVLMIEERDGGASPIQAKGIGELGMCGGAAAIANAIYNACGARVYDFPMTPDRVLAALPE